ncbi:MAG: CHAT domain-containing protein, partial [Holophagales bacterium]|nr:CHAT domain-containing protein [Holophagales bacterium]
PAELDLELEQIEAELGGHHDVEPVFVRCATLEDLRRRSTEVSPHVLHFLGHGTFSDGSGPGALSLAGSRGRVDPITGQDLAVALSGFPELRLVVLNACRSGSMPRKKGLDPFAGVASSLVLEGEVAAVVAMQFRLHEDAAVSFAGAFYGALAAGDPVEAAVAEGRQALFAQDREWQSHEWATPVLYLRTDHGRLFRFDSERLESVPAAGEAAGPVVETTRLPVTGKALFGRERELAVLDSAWLDPRIRIVVILAWGGVGKTSVINHWLQALEREDYRGAERVFAWSFYRQGTSSDRPASADEMLEEAAVWLGEARESLPAKPWNRGVRLAELVAERPTLFVLDGLEPLQYPPGELQGQVRDQGLRAFLRHQARAPSRSLCVITTRMAISDLGLFEGSSVRRLELSHLSPAAGTQLLRHLGVWGEDAALTAAVGEFDGHSLAVTLLGRYLKVVYGGDVEKVQLIPRLTDERDLGGHAWRMIAAYETWLRGTMEVGVLYLMGLFDRPAERAAVDALCVAEILRDLPVDAEHSEVGWRYAVERLREIDLLSAAEPGPRSGLDCHPLIREYFGTAFEARFPEVWIEAHRRLFEYYRNRPAVDQPEGLGALEPLFAAVTHGCEAKLYHEALEEVFLRRINRGKQSYSTKVLGAFSANLAALSHFFEQRWSRPVRELTASQQLLVLNRAGLFLSALGHVREAIDPIRRALELHRERQDWLGVARQAANIKEFHLKLGELDEVIHYSRLGLEAADRTDHLSQRISRRTTLANALHLRWEIGPAQALFEEAERLQRGRDGGPGYLRGLNGLKHTSLLIDLGRYDDALARLDHMSEKGGSDPQASLAARIHHNTGLLIATRARRGLPADLTAALELFDLAVGKLRETGRQDTLPYPLMERASVKGMLGDLAGARADLEEAAEICDEGDMKLNQVHILFTRADLHLAEGERTEAAACLVQAEAMAEGMGYRRAHLELERLRALL